MYFLHGRVAAVFLVSFLLIFIFLIGFPACMMVGMHKPGQSKTLEITKFEQSNESVLIDKLILEATKDLSATAKLSIESLAVWEIETQSQLFDTENVRQKIIASLVNNTSYKVISREHLDELLFEQSLSLSGTMDSTKAIKIGELM